MRADDQGLLHIVAAEHDNGRIHYLSHEDVWFPTNRVKNPILYHFTGMCDLEYRAMLSLLRL